MESVEILKNVEDVGSADGEFGGAPSWVGGWLIPKGPSLIYVQVNERQIKANLDQYMPDGSKFTHLLG